MKKLRLLLWALLAACADVGETAKDEPSDAYEALLATSAALDAAHVESDAAEPPFQAAMDACYAQRGAADGSLQVHTVGRYLALGDSMMAVQVSIPKAPRLARCIEDAVGRSVPPGWESAPDALASGSFAIDLGGPAPTTGPGDIERQYAEHQRGLAALMRDVVARGILPADHPLVREALSQP